ncbi:MAG: hypothetical protein O3B21_03075 [Proteobacteria bacterium]|nr:hypothetical protein [Pseudomonadota bacterium]MDA1357301.1 hypothetical protein [Pseudomonadota bacterium]
MTKWAGFLAAAITVILTTAALAGQPEFAAIQGHDVQDNSAVDIEGLKGGAFVLVRANGSDYLPDGVWFLTNEEAADILFKNETGGFDANQIAILDFGFDVQPAAGTDMENIESELEESEPSLDVGFSEPLESIFIDLANATVR